MLQYIQDHLDDNNTRSQQTIDKDEFMKDYYAQPPQPLEKCPTLQYQEKFIQISSKRSMTPTKRTEFHDPIQSKNWFKFLPETRKNIKNKDSFIEVYEPALKTHRSITPKKRILTLPSYVKSKTPPPKRRQDTLLTTKPIPTINENTQKIVEKRLQRDCKDKNSLSYQYFSKKEVSIQTIESIPNERRGAKPLGGRKRISQAPQQQRTVITTTTQILEYREFGIQTSPKNYQDSKKCGFITVKQLVVTPSKAQSVNGDVPAPPQQSRIKQAQQYSYYQPIHERYKLEIEKKKQFMDKALKQKQEKEDNQLGMLNKHSKKDVCNQLVYNGQQEKHDEVRIKEFSTTQLQWQEKKQNNAIKQRMLSQSKELDECTHKPRILPKSQRIAMSMFKQQGNLKTEDRLMEFQYNKDAHQREDEHSSTTTAKIRQSPQSKRINNRKILQSVHNKSALEFSKSTNIQTYYLGDDDDDDQAYDQHNFSWL